MMSMLKPSSLTRLCVGQGESSIATSSSALKADRYAQGGQGSKVLFRFRSAAKEVRPLNAGVRCSATLSIVGVL
jgi:hypothetical protein